jgi:excisionase family DNA binding protein
MEQSHPLPTDQEFLTVKQTAKFLNISASCVYRLCITGKMTHYKFGDGQGAIRINRTELQEFIERCRIDERKAQEVVGTGQRRSPSGYVCQRLFVEDRHPCVGATKAGTPCTRLTRGERCAQHQTERKKKAK